MNRIEFLRENAPATFVGMPVRRRRFWTAKRFGEFLGLVDVALLIAAGVLANLVRFGTPDISGVRGMTLILAALLTWMLFRQAKLHDPELLANATGQLRRVATALAMVFFAMLVIGYAFKTSEAISRLWVAIWFAGTLGAVFLARLGAAHIYRQRQAAGHHVRRLAICTSVRSLGRVEQFMQRWRELGPQSEEIVGIFLDRPNEIGNRAFAWRHLVRGSVEDLLQAAEGGLIDSTLVIIPSRGCDNMEPVIQKLRTVSMDVDLLAGEVDPVWANRPVGKIAGLPVMRIMRRPLDETQLLLKRGLDLATASAALTVFGLPMLLIALAIKLDSPGPALFRQYRHGFNNRPFQVFKFRTMYHRRDKSVCQARRNDPRVTRVGAILRRTSLDELPQLFNVLRGEMSIVGPRPHACEHNDQFARLIDSYLARHRIKPGITGWAQVHGYRGETDTVEKMRKRVEYDLHYADNWSVRLDLKIMIMTLGCFFHRNAY
ncbi:MAG: undecaprenyl-phosphate glucose phosphotransferase [Alphaproteobacteria bacterium]